MSLKHLYYRAFQFCFGLGARLLPWRQPKCLSGPGSLGRLPQLLAEQDVRKPMIVASRRQSETAEFLAMVQQFSQWELFSQVTSDPSVELVDQLAARYRTAGCDCLIAIGGGSPMDAAKAAAARLARPKKSVPQLKGLLKVCRKVPLLAAVPTTAGTGSETTIAAVVTDGRHKYAISDLCLIPRVAVLDPCLTVTLPPSITAQTGMDALTHAVEAYIGLFYNTEETRRMAEEAVVSIFRWLPRACQDGNDLNARQALLTASYQAGCAFTRASVGNVHAIAHTLGGLYHIPHGLANAVLLPVILRDYGATAHRPLARLARLTGCCSGGTEAQQAQAFIDAIFSMNRQLGIPTGFDCIRPEDREQMVQWALAEANPTYPVPVIYDRERILRILQQITLSQ